MASFNKVIIMGNLTRDPEIRQGQNGNYITKAGIAVNESKPDGQGGYRDEAHFFDVTFFGRQAESFAKWFKKGRPVLIEGRLNYGTWEDRETGQKRSKVDIVGLRWHFVGGRDEQAGGGNNQQSNSQSAPAGGGSGFPEKDDFVPDDVPF